MTPSTNSKPTRARLDADLGVPVLAPPARLADETALALGRLANGLAVCHLRPTDVCVDRELALEAVDNNLEVQLAHAAR